MDKCFTLSNRGARFNAYRPRHVFNNRKENAPSPKPETLAFLMQFARAFYPGNGSRTLNVVLN